MEAGGSLELLTRSACDKDLESPHALPLLGERPPTWHLDTWHDQLWDTIVRRG